MIKVVSTKFLRTSKVINNAFATFDLLKMSFDLLKNREKIWCPEKWEKIRFPEKCDFLSISWKM
jgi:hypothetical protein